MFKRLFIIGMLCIGIVIMLPPDDAEALKTRLYTGTFFSMNGLDGTVTGEGPGNYDKWPGQLTMTVFPRYVSLLCTNPQKKKFPNRQGKVYFWEGEVSQTEPSADWEIKNNGAFTVFFNFTNYQLFGALGCPEDACDTNPKWDCARDEDGNTTPLLLEFDATMLLESYLEGFGWFEDFFVGVRCNLNEDLETFTCVDDCDDPEVCFNYNFEWPR